MLERLKTAHRVVGIKQSTRAVKDGNALMAFIAEDADRRVTQQLESLCIEKSIEVIRVDTMKELGEACGIDVGAATAVIIKTV
jgi:large subunit ribosomal protein L7A